LHLLRPATPAWTPEVLTCSALHGQGIGEVWQAVRRHRKALEQSGELTARRSRQARSWLWAEIQAGLVEGLRADPESRQRIHELEREVEAGTLLPPQAARRLVGRFLAGPT
jgi:LAO/AO transport system kinase